MPLIAYPTWLPQCEPTQREEVTTVLSEVSESGVIRGRVMHRHPTYQLTLSHNEITKTDFLRWETWWDQHDSDEVVVTWAADQQSYRGIFSVPPTVEYAPFQRFTVGVTLLVKKVLNTPQIAIPGAPGKVIEAAPDDLADAISHGALGNTSAWTTGQYIVLGDTSEAHWDGTTWKVGKAP